MLKHDVGNRIRYLRKRLGISQEKLALKSDLDRTYLAGIESGKRNATLDSIEKIIQSLDISVKDFFNFEQTVDYE